jgi:hypothetical protein
LESFYKFYFTILGIKNKDTESSAVLCSKKQDTLKKLPLEIILNIIKYLPIESLNNLSLVNKIYYNLSPNFSLFKALIRECLRNPKEKNISYQHKDWDSLSQKQIKILREVQRETFSNLHDFLIINSDMNPQLFKEVMDQKICFFPSSIEKKNLLDNNNCLFLGKQEESLTNLFEMLITTKDIDEKEIVNNYNLIKILCFNTLYKNKSEYISCSEYLDHSIVWKNYELDPESKSSILRHVIANRTLELDKFKIYNCIVDETIARIAVRVNGLNLGLLDDNLLMNTKIVRKALKQNGLSLGYAYQSDQKNKELVIEAIKQNPNAFKYVHKNLCKDPEILALLPKKSN